MTAVMSKTEIELLSRLGTIRNFLKRLHRVYSALQRTNRTAQMTLSTSHGLHLNWTLRNLDLVIVNWGTVIVPMMYRPTTNFAVQFETKPSDPYRSPPSSVRLLTSIYRINMKQIKPLYRLLYRSRWGTIFPLNSANSRILHQYRRSPSSG